MGVTISTHNGSAVAREHNIRNPKVVSKEAHIKPNENSRYGTMKNLVTHTIAFSVRHWKNTTTSRNVPTERLGTTTIISATIK